MIDAGPVHSSYNIVITVDRLFNADRFIIPKRGSIHILADLIRQIPYRSTDVGRS